MREGKKRIQSQKLIFLTSVYTLFLRIWNIKRDSRNKCINYFLGTSLVTCACCLSTLNMAIFQLSALQNMHTVFLTVASSALCMQESKVKQTMFISIVFFLFNLIYIAVKCAKQVPHKRILVVFFIMRSLLIN